MSKQQTLTLQEVEALSRDALSGAGAIGIQLEQATTAIVEAEADGIRTVGLGYLPIYCEQLLCGKTNGSAQPTHAQSAGAVIHSDAAQGFSFAAFHEAMDDFHALASDQGIAALSIYNSTSAGVLGWFVERTAKAGLIGLGFANSPSLMTAHGGKHRFFGTNPLAFAIPRAAGLEPLIADMATSQVAYVTVKDHAERGEKIPLGWGLDKDGQPTTDPHEVLNGGGLAPAGGYKGALLALLVDVLAGGLAGPHFSFQASSFGNTEGPPPDTGQFFIAIAPDRFADQSNGPGALADRLEVMLTALEDLDGVRLPGNSRYANRARAAREGVQVEAELIEKLRAYA